MAVIASAVSGGRFDLHVVNGGAPGEQYREGDYLPHDDRYRRAHKHVRVLRPVLKPPVPVPTHMGRAGDAALQFGGAHTDVYLLWAEPMAASGERVASIDAAAAADRPGPQLSPYLGQTDQQAWELARSGPVFQAYREKGGAVSDWEHAEDARHNLQLRLSATASLTTTACGRASSRRSRGWATRPRWSEPPTGYWRPCSVTSISGSTPC